MGFLLNLDFLRDTVAAEPKGLDLAADAIDDVIKQIDLELSELVPVEFRVAGSIQSASFGGADRAPNLALHHTRAHEVIWKTLLGVKQDLETFQEACRNAKNEIIGTDEDVADRQRRTTAAIEILQAGSTGRDGRDAHQQARQDQDVTGGDAGDAGDTGSTFEGDA